MNFVFKKVGLVCVNTDKNTISTVKLLINQLKKFSFKIILEKDTAYNLQFNKNHGYILKYVAKNCDIIIIVGGDGSFINISREISYIHDVPILGINQGKLGFLTEISPYQITNDLLTVLSGKYQEETRFMIKAIIERKKVPIKEIVALNDIVIATSKFSKIFQFCIHVLGKFAIQQNADGIIIATPTGSTAHALSAGGPIIHPSLNVILLVTIFSHSLNNRPIILQNNSDIEIKITHHNNPQVNLIFDGNQSLQLMSGDIIKINKYRKKVRIIHSLNYDYFYLLRSKLKWGEMLY